MGSKWAGERIENAGLSLQSRQVASLAMHTRQRFGNLHSGWASVDRNTGLLGLGAPPDGFGLLSRGGVAGQPTAIDPAAMGSTALARKGFVFSNGEEYLRRQFGMGGDRRRPARALWSVRQSGPGAS